MRLGCAIVVGFAATAAQGQQTARVCLVDPAGRAVVSATILERERVAGGRVERMLTDGNGCVAAHAGPTWVAEIAVGGFEPVSVSGLVEGETRQVVLKPGTQQSVTVTADRGLAGIDDAASSVAVLSEKQLQAPAGLTLDDSLHQVAGFQLFRRTSSWTANPTTEGVSLRGLGSTAASRTLVVSDQVPLNDPYGAWIHWNEIPALVLQSVNILRGGAAD